MIRKEAWSFYRTISGVRLKDLKELAKYSQNKLLCIGVRQKESGGEVPLGAGPPWADVSSPCPRLAVRRCRENGAGQSRCGFLTSEFVRDGLPFFFYKTAASSTPGGISECKVEARGRRRPTVGS